MAGALLILSLIPFLLVPLPPLNDYPSHLARAHIISTLDGSPELQRYYSVEWHVIPNLALDLVVPVMAKILPVEMAMSVFTAASLVLVLTGVIAIHRALFRRTSLAPLAVFLIAYNRQFLWGFLNFFFALGVCFWMFAGWVYLRDRTWRLRIPLFSVMAAVLFLLHLHALGVYAVLVGGYEISQAFFLRNESSRSSMRNLFIGAVQFLPAFVLAGLSPTRDRIDETEYGTLLYKIAGLLDSVHAYSMPLDALTFLFIIGVLGLGLLTGSAVVHRAMIVPLLLLVLLYWVLPARIFGSLAADRRLATAGYMILAGCMGWRFSSRRIATVLALVVLSLILVRTGLVAYRWQQSGDLYQQYATAFEMVPSGSRVAAAVAKTGNPLLEHPPVMFIPSWAVVRRDVFVNSNFADHGHQPLSLKYRPADVASHRLAHIFFLNGDGDLAHANDPLQRINTSEYDYVLLINQHLFRTELPPNLVPVTESPNRFALYRVEDRSGSSTLANGSGQGRPR